jgi:nitrogen fixation/metabolism regulation signal transduction histidine kinase
VYIFLFLLAGAVSIAVGNSITRPLSRLAENVKKFKLGKHNEALQWDSNDEIGILIKNYNNLTTEVVNSAELLAKTQRDMAWREMAKQVAHEIKNPLTPMKLNIQYLEKVIQSDPDSAHLMIQRISGTLIEQINNLTQIADEFSNFATLPKAANEKIILNEVVEHIHDLFRKRDDMEIELLEPMNEIYVFADRNHLVRVLNNIVKNAIQAVPEYRRGKIIIDLQVVDAMARIKVSDNGLGIPEDMKDKVFTPNFTTKSSGTGLGLAISANMMETMNGRIYFNSKPNEGTDFYIELPLIRNEELPTTDGEVFLEDV